MFVCNGCVHVPLPPFTLVVWAKGHVKMPCSPSDSGFQVPGFHWLCVYVCVCMRACMGVWFLIFEFVSALLVRFFTSILYCCVLSSPLQLSRLGQGSCQNALQSLRRGFQGSSCRYDRVWLCVLEASINF